MPGPPKKTNSKAHSRGQKQPTTSLVLAVDNPTPPRELTPAILESWNAFWQSPLAVYVRETDLPALKRLFTMYDELERTRESILAEPDEPPVRNEYESHNDFQIRYKQWRIETQASGRLMAANGGLKLNPLLTYMLQLEKIILPLEDRFGFNLRMRQELGLNEMRAQTLKEHNERTSGRSGGSSEDPPPDDPRLRLMPGAR